jgi:hypothetical protein
MHWSCALTLEDWSSKAFGGTIRDAPRCSSIQGESQTDVDGLTEA